MLGKMNSNGDGYQPSDKEYQLSTDPGDNPQPVEHANKDGIEEPPAPSIRLTTIIDRMLDTSLGTGRGLETVPVNKRILNQIAVDELASSQTSQNKQKNEAGKTLTTTTSFLILLDYASWITSTRVWSEPFPPSQKRKRCCFATKRQTNDDTASACKAPSPARPRPHDSGAAWISPVCAGYGGPVDSPDQGGEETDHSCQ